LKKVPVLEQFSVAADAGRYLGYCFLLTSLLLLISDNVRRTRVDEAGNRVSLKGKE
jgi:hypothetical protein